MVTKAPRILRPTIAIRKLKWESQNDAEKLVHDFIEFTTVTRTLQISVTIISREAYK